MAGAGGCRSCGTRFRDIMFFGSTEKEAQGLRVIHGMPFLLPAFVLCVIRLPRTKAYERIGYKDERKSEICISYSYPSV